MKIGNKSLATRRHKTLSLVRDDGTIDIVVCSAPQNYFRRLTNIGVYEVPKPPIGFKQGAGNKYLKDRNGELIQFDNFDDPDYKRDAGIAIQRMIALRLRIHLADDPTVSFDAVAPTTDDLNDWCEYADKLVEEIRDCGLTDPEITEICNVGASLTNGFKIDEAIDSF